MYANENFRDDLHHVCRTLVHAGADVTIPGCKGLTPLHAAAGVGDSDMTCMLLQAGAQPNAADCDGETPLHRAVAFGFQDVCAALVDADADPAIRCKTIGLANLLNGAHFDFSETHKSEGISSLELASMFRRHRVVSLLICQMSRKHDCT